jgi:hypothetical protein
LFVGLMIFFGCYFGVIVDWFSEEVAMEVAFILRFGGFLGFCATD